MMNYSVRCFLCVAIGLFLMSARDVRAADEMSAMRQVQTEFSQITSESAQPQTPPSSLLQDNEQSGEVSLLRTASPEQLVMWWTFLVTEMAFLAWAVYHAPHV